MKQYCRYCAYCVYGDVIYCEKKEKTMSINAAKRINKCKNFTLNELDVFDITKKYKPKVKTKKLFEHTKLF